MHLTTILVPLLTSLPSILANPTLDEIAPLDTRQSVLKQGVPCPGQNLSVTCSTDETEVVSLIHGSFPIFPRPVWLTWI